MFENKIYYIYYIYIYTYIHIYIYTYIHIYIYIHTYIYIYIYNIYIFEKPQWKNSPYVENSGRYKLRSLLCPWKCHPNFSLSPIRRSKPKFLNLKVFIDLSRSIPAQFLPFSTWIFYTYMRVYLRVYQYFPRLHYLHRFSVTHSLYLPPPPPINFFLLQVSEEKGH